MYHKTRNLFPLFFGFICLVIMPNETNAQDCSPENRLCILDQIKTETKNITNQSWKDQTYRELAKTYAFDRHFDKAVEIIPLIKTPDTKAMTIRGIGMTVAAQNHTPEKYRQMFATLRSEAEKVKHPPSYAIALTYIAMAQAFAGDNEGAWKTAADMNNEALRNKAYGETAEIQAEKGNFEAAKISIEKIQSTAFKNKAYKIVSKILADNGAYSDAYSAARAISNPYKKTQSLRYILDAQKPRDVKH